jgi:hypothetical protein
MLNRLKVRLALWLLSDLTIRDRDELLSIPHQNPVVLQVNGTPVWFVDVQRVDTSNLEGLGHIVEVKTCGHSVADCFSVIGIPDHLGEPHAQS